MDLRLGVSQATCLCGSCSFLKKGFVVNDYTGLDNTFI